MVKGSISEAAGYTETVCIQCRFGLQARISNSFVVTQTMDCSTSLAANSDYSPVDANYDALISFND